MLDCILKQGKYEWSVIQETILRDVSLASLIGLAKRGCVE